jgi:hypothetical protein
VARTSAVIEITSAVAIAVLEVVTALNSVGRVARIDHPGKGDREKPHVPDAEDPD